MVLPTASCFPMEFLPPTHHLAWIFQLSLQVSMAPSVLGEASPALGQTDPPQEALTPYALTDHYHSSNGISDCALTWVMAVSLPRTRPPISHQAGKSTS